jgi:Lon protease-like protein
VSELLPLFPLTTVLFPGVLLPLHIFEPRYRLLVRRCVERERPFGVVLIREGAEVGATADPYAIGTEARIVGLTALPDGRSYIVTKGERRFAVDSVIADAEPYLVGRVRYLSELEGVGARAQVGEAIEALGGYLLAVAAATEDERGEAALARDLKEAGPVEVAYRIAGTLAIDAQERQNLLELETASDRLREETRILGRETELLRDLLVRLRVRGDRRELN